MTTLKFVYQQITQLKNELERDAMEGRKSKGCCCKCLGLKMTIGWSRIVIIGMERKDWPEKD